MRPRRGCAATIQQPDEADQDHPEGAAHRAAQTPAVERRAIVFQSLSGAGHLADEQPYAHTDQHGPGPSDGRGRHGISANCRPERTSPSQSARSLRLETGGRAGDLHRDKVALVELVESAARHMRLHPVARPSWRPAARRPTTKPAGCSCKAAHSDSEAVD